MAITVSGKNYNQISSCDTITSGGSWSLGGPAQDLDNFVEGSASCSFPMKSSGINTIQFDPTTAVNFTGVNSSHVRFWIINANVGLLSDTDAAIEIGMSHNNSTWGYWNLNAERYVGGWKNMVVDTARACDSGTKPTMSAITNIQIRCTQSANGKNFDNVSIDNICQGDGLLCYGDDAGGYFDFEDIFTADNGTLGIGIIRKISGVYYVAGSLEFGDSAGTAGCKFQAKSQAVIFENRPVASTLYGLNIVDNGTGTTEFITGDKVGTAGVQGCTIRTASENQTPKFYVDGATDTDVDNFKLYGTTFFDAGLVTFPGAAATVEILGCSFESCLQVDPDDASVKGCFFINTSDTDSALLWNESINISSCSFIGNTVGAGIEMPSSIGTPYAYNALLFSGNTYDVLNSSGSSISVNKNSGSDPTSYEGSTVTFLGVSVDTIITCKNVTNLQTIENVRVLLEAADGAGALNFEESVTEITRVTTTATVTHTAHGLATDDWVHIKGANQPEYNICAQITVTDVDTYTYQVSGAPITPATGTIKSTEVIFNKLTNSSGIVSDSRTFASNQNVTGKARKTTTTPLYKNQPITGTIDKDTGLSLTILLIPDE